MTRRDALSGIELQRLRELVGRVRDPAQRAAIETHLGRVNWARLRELVSQFGTRAQRAEFDEYLVRCGADRLSVPVAATTRGTVANDAPTEHQPRKTLGTQSGEPAAASRAGKPKTPKGDAEKRFKRYLRKNAPLLRSLLDRLRGDDDELSQRDLYQRAWTILRDYKAIAEAIGVSRGHVTRLLKKQKINNYVRECLGLSSKEDEDEFLSNILTQPRPIAATRRHKPIGAKRRRESLGGR